MFGGVVATLTTSAVLAAFRSEVTTATAALVLVLWVVAAAATGDRLAGLLTALSAGLWFNFFLTEPYHRLTIDDPDDVEVVVLLLVVGLAVTEVATWGHRHQARAARRSGYLEGVLATAELVASADVREGIEMARRQIQAVLDVPRCDYVPGPVHDSRLAIMDHEGDVTRAGRSVDVGRHGLPFDEQVALVVQRGPTTLGHFVITSASRISYPTREQRRVAVLLANQVAGAIDAKSSG